MIGKNGNFLTAHYDWIAAAVAVVALAAGGMMFFGALGTDPDALANAKEGEIERMTPGGEAVQAADLTDFTRVTKTAKSPTSLSEVTDDKGSFLASEARMFCTNAQCQAAVVKDAKACPTCGAVLEVIKAEDKDADGDGLPDDWEKKHFKSIAACDPNADADGDGFANGEEYEAKTDPADKDDHPDYLNYLKVQLPLKETVLPFYFTGVMKTPGGLKFQFKDPSRAREYDRGVYSLLAGDEIGKSGFSPKEYVAKTAEKTMGGGMKKKVDASEAVVVRKSDGKAIAMTIGKKGVPVDVQATLAYSRDGGKTKDVVPGEAIELSGAKYVVRKIEKAAKGANVTVEDAKGKIRVLSALEP